MKTLTLRDNRHFHLGKRARFEGLPCRIEDGRLTVVNRQAWIEGWQEQDRLMQPPGPPEAVTATRDFLTRLKALLRTEN